MSGIRKIARKLIKPCEICGKPTRYKGKDYGWKCGYCKVMEQFKK